MKARTCIVSILMALLIGCTSTIDRQIEDGRLRESISGEWERIIENETSLDNFPPPPPSFLLPQGMAFTNDSIEIYLGFYKEGDRDSITGRRTSVYLGNIAAFKVDQANIIIKNPSNNKWETKWKFISRKNDTLELAVSDTTIVRYKKLHYNLDTLPNFDQIIFSNSGCYGSCPILDISIDNKGSILFQGEGYVKPLGFYSGKLGNKSVNYIFDKFRRANPLGILNRYSDSRTDDQLITTTLIQNGRIVKTIHDYGLSGTKELIWAYIPILNIHNTVRLDSLPFGEPFYPKLHYFRFEKNGLILPLEKSESFYLWTELKKSKQVDQHFNAEYKLSFIGNYTYSGPDPNGSRKSISEIEEITTDGQLYKFEFTNDNPVIYDLGYNFLERNFKSIDFREPEKWE